MKAHKNYEQLRRQRLIEQLGGECVHCRSTLMLEIDHITPILTQDRKFRAKDLRNPNLSNLQLLCKPCHILKSNKDGSHDQPI